MPEKLHPDEVPTDVAVARQLVREQFPEWAHLSVTEVAVSGTDHAGFHLGKDKLVRLPRRASAELQTKKETRWLPRLAQHLPLAVPQPLRLGRPAPEYPFCWAVYRWLEGEEVRLDRLLDASDAARELAGFVQALQSVDAMDGPPPGSHNFFRGEPLAARDARTRAAIIEVAERFGFDRGALEHRWDDALSAPVWQSAPCWVHGDLQPGNLLQVRGRLSAVIDFGGLGVGDPACDLMVAWNLFTEPSRGAFRAALMPDAASWARGRGWALSVSVLALPYYATSHTRLANVARHALEEILADLEGLS